MEEGDRTSARARAVGEGQGVFLEVIMMVYGDVTWREAEGGVGSHREE